MLLLPLLSLGLSLLGLTLAQHNAPVGPLTALSTKSHICNVKDYGGVPDNSTDVGLAITRAFKECIKDGSTLVIPEGTWAIKSSVTMRGKNKWAFQL
jgi:rhamnogalacturonan hydrolase